MFFPFLVKNLPCAKKKKKKKKKSFLKLNLLRLDLIIHPSLSPKVKHPTLDF